MIHTSIGGRILLNPYHMAIISLKSTTLTIATTSWRKVIHHIVQIRWICFLFWMWQSTFSPALVWVHANLRHASHRDGQVKNRLQTTGELDHKANMVEALNFVSNPNFDTYFSQKWVTTYFNMNNKFCNIPGTKIVAHWLKETKCQQTTLSIWGGGSAMWL